MKARQSEAAHEANQFNAKYFNLGFNAPKRFSTLVIRDVSASHLITQNIIIIQLMRSLSEALANGLLRRKRLCLQNRKHIKINHSRFCWCFHE